LGGGRSIWTAVVLTERNIQQTSGRMNRYAYRRLSGADLPSLHGIDAAASDHPDVSVLGLLSKEILTKNQRVNCLETEKVFFSGD